MSNKMIIVFCDGTGQDGLISYPDRVTNSIWDASHVATNVLRLSRAVQPYSSTQTQQLVFYQSGVGSETNFNGDYLGTKGAISLAIQSTGIGVAAKIRDAYAFIAQNYQDGDDICIFGFSRGAYTARKVAGLIDKIGLLLEHDLRYLFTIWRMLVNGQTPVVPLGTKTVTIKCVGVWDTVGSVSQTIDALHIKDDSFPASIEIGLHALSLQENRKQFLPTLWSVPAAGLGSNQTLKQIWFPGSHSDVGGGYSPHEPADISLFWMAGEIKSFVNLDLDFLEGCKQPNPVDWGTSQPHNEYAHWLIPFSEKNRLESGQITKDSLFHQSLKFAPTKQQLVEPDNMITLDVLQQAFGSSWTPSYPTLNDFEQKCKNEWSNANSDPTVFESFQDLFDGPVKWIMGVPELLTQLAIEGGNDSSGSPLYIGRGLYEGGIHPGKASPNWSGVNISWGGKEVNVDPYDMLIGLSDYVRWVSVSGSFSLDDAPTPVEGGNESDNTTLYIARAAYEGGIHNGKVKVGGVALIPYGGDEVSLSTYEVLIYTTPDYWKSNMMMGDYETSGGSNSEVVSVSQVATPQVAIGLMMLDISNGANNHGIRTKADVDNISSNQFTIHIDTWSDTTLYNAAVSWLALAADDPYFQIGVFDTQDVRSWDEPGNVVQRVNFPRTFESPPKVVVGISEFDIGDNWRLRVYATDIDAKGFTIHAITWGSSDLYSVRASWIAFPADKEGVWSGSFSSEDVPGIYHGEDDFGITFSKTPSVFMALTEFDISHDYNLRVRLGTNSVTTSSLNWYISTWSDTMLYMVGGMYVALEM